MGGAKRKGFSHRSVSGPARNGGDNNGDMRPVNNIAAERQERELLVLWRHPLTTLEYFVREVSVIVRSSARGLLKHRVSMFVGLVGVAGMLAVTNTAGPHTAVVNRLRAVLLWCLYWLGLGVLSSVGLGTGLHTFLLYLGPHIAAVTLAAYECGSLNFPEPPYPDDIICPETVDARWSAGVWNIMRKVMLEAMMWGAGTALGELPPYFMARAARLSGYDPEDEDELREFEELQIKKKKPELMTYLDRAKIIVERLVKRVGFLGILVCASIPNPLFDLAGITCGHFLVPFWTFFGATLIGKAVIKMMLQEVFVIVAFSDVLIARAMDVMGRIPAVGPKLQAPLQTFLVRQKERLHRRADTRVSSDNNLLAKAFEVFVIAMVVYFVISIVNSLAQSHHKRLHKKKKVKKHSND